MATAGMEERGEKSSIGSRGQMCSAPSLSLSLDASSSKGLSTLERHQTSLLPTSPLSNCFLFNRCLCLCSVEDLHVALVGLLVFQDRSFAFILI